MNHKDSHLEIRLARDENDLRAAQRLRYQVFVHELGGKGGQIDHNDEIEADKFDAFCDHLILIDKDRDQSNGPHVVGAYRMMTKPAAEKAGGFYTSGEYDLTRLQESGRSLLELGRSCVHPDHRGGMAMFYLWNGLAKYVADNQIDLLFGVASFHGTDVNSIAEPLSYLYQNHLAPEALRVRTLENSYQRMDLLDPRDTNRARAMKNTPALIKAYLRLGGFVGDGAFIDRPFNTTDVCLVMDTERMSAAQKNFYGRGRRG